jgi:hypothetical protein
MYDRPRLDRPDQIVDPTPVAQIKFVVEKVAERLTRRCWFQRVSPAGPKKLARMLLSTPWTRHPRSAK